MLRDRILMVAALTVIGCDSGPVKRPVETGETALQQFECNRCHSQVAELPEFALNENCTACHRAILAGHFDSRWPEATVTRWKQNVDVYTKTPTLKDVQQRLRRDWFIDYVQEPYDTRPNLPEMMPRLGISLEDAIRLADELGLVNGGDGDFGDAEKGGQLFEERACGACHDFTGVLTPPAERLAAALLAPDLRWTRARFRHDKLVEWLDSPASLKPGTSMPDLLDAEEARDVAAWLFGVEISEVPGSKQVDFLPLLDREISFEEVNKKVFSRLCIHCHNDGRNGFSRGDGGPGSSGGFGFEGRALHFSNQKNAEKVAPLISRALRARHAEIRGEKGELRGMPLGLPPLDLEDIQLLESWAHQVSKDQ